MNYYHYESAYINSSSHVAITVRPLLSRYTRPIIHPLVNSAKTTSYSCLVPWTAALDSRLCFVQYRFSASYSAIGTPCPGHPTMSALRYCAAQSPLYSILSYFCSRRITVLTRQNQLMLFDAPCISHHIQTFSRNYTKSHSHHLLINAISVMAKFCPMQIRGPPLKGTNCHGLGVQWSHRSGLKIAGSANVSDTGG